MLYTVMLLGTFTVVEAVKSTNKITCNTTYPVESDIVGVFFSAAAWAGLADDTCISAAWVAVNRVIYCTIANA